MKKIILSLITISFILILSGCSKPKVNYKAGEEGYDCGNAIVVLSGSSQSVSGTKEGKRDSTGFLTYSTTASSRSRKMAIHYSMGKPFYTRLSSNGTFRMPRPRDTNGRARPTETWSFRKMTKEVDGKKVKRYFYGTTAYPKNRFLDGNWCERIH